MVRESESESSYYQFSISLSLPPIYLPNFGLQHKHAHTQIHSTPPIHTHSPRINLIFESADKIVEGATHRLFNFTSLSCAAFTLSHRHKIDVHVEQIFTVAKMATITRNHKAEDVTHRIVTFK